MYSPCVWWSVGENEPHCVDIAIQSFCSSQWGINGRKSTVTATPISAVRYWISRKIPICFQGFPCWDTALNGQCCTFHLKVVFALCIVLCLSTRLDRVFFWLNILLRFFYRVNLTSKGSCYCTRGGQCCLGVHFWGQRQTAAGSKWLW